MNDGKMCWVCRTVVTLEPSEVCRDCQDMGRELAGATVLFDCQVCGQEREADVIHCNNTACPRPCERLECRTCGNNVAVN